MSESDSSQSVQDVTVIANEEKQPYQRRQSETSVAAKILELHSKGMDGKDIATVVGKAYSTVRRIINEFKPVFKELENIDEMRDISADLCAAGRIAALKSAFTGKKLEKAGFLSTLQGAEILNKMERLERGQSTENHAVNFIGRMTSTKVTD